MHYVGANLRKNGVKIGDTLIEFDPNERVLSLQVPDVCAKSRQNRLKIATIKPCPTTLATIVAIRRLSPKTATVAKNGDCSRIRRL